jgi:hypothetical protein
VGEGYVDRRGLGGKGKEKEGQICSFPISTNLMSLIPLRAHINDESNILPISLDNMIILISCHPFFQNIPHRSSEP